VRQARGTVSFEVEIEPFVEREDAHISIEAGRTELRRRLRRTSFSSPTLSAGDIDAQWEMAESYGDETAGASAPTPDQNVVDEWAEAIGVHYDDFEELRCGDKEHERDVHRWELDPASAEDYFERTRESSCRA